MPDDLKKLLMVLLILIAGVHMYRNRAVDPYVFKGDECSMRFPDEWIKAEDKAPMGVMLVSEVSTPTQVTYYSPTKDFLKNSPHAAITLVMLKMDRSIWIDDEFGEIAGALGQAYRILDQGEVDLEQRKARWILYFDKRSNLMVMEFYFADFTQMFYKLRFVSVPEKFNEYRPAFEQAKSTFKFKRGNPPKF